MKRALTPIGALMSLCGLIFFFFNPDQLVLSGFIVAIGAIIMGGIPKMDKVLKHIEIPLAFLIVGIFAGVFIYHNYGVEDLTKTASHWILGVFFFGACMAPLLRALLEK